MNILNNDLMLRGLFRLWLLLLIKNDFKNDLSITLRNNLIILDQIQIDQLFGNFSQGSKNPDWFKMKLLLELPKSHTLLIIGNSKSIETLESLSMLRNKIINKSLFLHTKL